MGDNIFEKMTEEERTLVWIYMIFNKDKIIEKTEQWTKEAEKAGMTLTEYLESINPLNKSGSEDKEWANTENQVSLMMFHLRS